MPAHNSAQFIRAAIASVRQQTMSDWELLVSDDASSDNTVGIVSHMASGDNRIRILIGARNTGPAEARNRAIEASSGRYIAFLDSDDLWKPTKLERQLGFMQARNIAFSFSSYDRVTEDGQTLGSVHVEKPVDYRTLLKSCVIGCLTAVYDTRMVGKVYMPEIRRRQDFGLWLKLLKQVEYAHPIPESLATYRVRTGSTSFNKVVAAQYTWRLYRQVERLPVHEAAYYFMHYAARGLWSRYGTPRRDQ